MENSFEEKSRKSYDLYLKQIASGIMYGPMQGKASLDKPWLRVYSDDAVLSPLPKMSAYRYLYEHNQNNLDNYAISYFGVKVTYRDLFKKIDEMAKSFRMHGVKENDVVAICCANTPEIVYIFYALSKIGAVADIIDPRINENVMLKYLKDVDTKLFMCLDLSLPKYYDIIEKTNIKTVVSLPILESLPLPMRAFARAKECVEHVFLGKDKMPKIKLPKDLKYETFSEFKYKGKDASVREASYIENRPVAIIHTGGTTGTPKGAILSNDNLNALVHQLRRTDLKFKKEDVNNQVWLNLMPPCVAYGLANGMHLSLSCSMQSILIPTYEPEKIDEMILKYKPNRLTCSPAHWEYFAHSEMLKGKDLSYLIKPIEGGDTINVELEKSINEILHKQGCNDNLSKGYGMSETCAALTVANSAVSNELLLSSVGFPLVDTVVSIFEPLSETNKEIKELGYNEIGEVCACSPNVMLGYHNRPEENVSTLITHPDGKVWIHSGDLGYMTEDGRLFIKGRLKRIIIRFDGTKVYAKDIEDVIATYPGVELVSVVGVKDSSHEQGEVPKAYIVLKDGYKNNKEAIEQIAMICNSHLIDYMVPFAYEELDKMPYTAIGKVDFMKLKSLQTSTNEEKSYSRKREM